MKYPTILDVMEIKIPEGIHGQSLFPLIRDERVAIRKYGCYNKFGEAINVADGRWTLFQWPSGERITPLHWYSSRPPQFLIPNAFRNSPTSSETKEAAMRCNHTGWFVILLTAVMIGCATSGTNRSAPVNAKTSNTPQQKSGIADLKPSNIAASSRTEAEHFIKMNEAGNVIGQIQIAVLRTDQTATGNLMKRIREWEKTLNGAGFAQIKFNLERPQPPHAISTNAPLLYVTTLPVQSKNFNFNTFTEQLEGYIQRGGLVFFDGLELPPQLFRTGMDKRVEASHPLLTIPYSITGLSRSQLPRILEINGKAGAVILASNDNLTSRRRYPSSTRLPQRNVVFGLHDSPSFQRLGVNLLAFAIANHAAGKSYLKNEKHP